MTVTLHDGTQYEQLEYVGAADGMAYYHQQDGTTLVIPQSKISHVEEDT